MRLLIVLLLVVSAHAKAIETELFRDSFDDPLFSNWEPKLRPDTNGWSNVDTGTNNAACYNGSGHMQLAANVLAIAEAPNYRIETRLKFLSSSNHPGGLRFGADPNGDSWALWAYPTSGELILYKTSAWNIDTPPLTTLAVANGVDMSMTDSTGAPRYHDVVVEIVAGMATVHWDGTSVMTHDLGVIRAGAIGLDVSNQPVCLDDVVFTALDEPTPPEPADPNIQVLFSDDFSGSMGSWAPSPLAGGLFTLTTTETLSFDGFGHTQLYVPGFVCGNCTASVDMTLQTGSNYPGGIRFRVDENTGQGYAAWLYPSDQAVKLLRVDGTAWHIDDNLTMLGQATVALVAGEPVELGLRGNADGIEVLVNGVSVITAMDSTYAEGTLAIDASNQPVMYDNALVVEPVTFAFIDLFDDPDFTPFDPSQWFESPLGDGAFLGWTRTLDGYAKYDGAAHKQAVTNWEGSDYRLDTIVRVGSGSYPGGPCMRVDQATGARYCVWLYPGSGTLNLYEVNGWHIDTAGFTTLGTASVGSLAPNTDYPLSIEGSGNGLRVWFNDPERTAPVIEATSSTLQSGAVALDVSQTTVQYAEVRVVGISLEPTPPVVYGPGGPILGLYSSQTNPSGQYLSPILQAEGLSAYTVQAIETVTATELGDHDIVILGEMPLTADQAAMLVSYVENGGHLIAMRPDPQLNVVLGLIQASGTTSEGYYLVDKTVPAGAGITDVTMQFHGTADHFTAVDDVVSVATIYSDRATATPYPAITTRHLPQGGTASAFAFNLPLSIVYTRQGNPAWVGQDRDAGFNVGGGLLRSDDLFFGPSLTDPQLNWVDLERIHIPQADELQRLLVQMVYDATSIPLPRTWYLPRGLKAAVVETGDDHGSGNSIPRFEEYLQLSPSGCSLVDWECYRMTSYAYNGVLGPAEVTDYTQLGFEPALHISTSCTDYSEAMLRNVMDEQLQEWDDLYADVGRPVTNRTHCIAWSGWSITPRVSLEHGIRLDTNYYYWPPEWGIAELPGYMTGSGLPQEFSEMDGRPIAVYQAHTHLTDETAADSVASDRTTPLMALHIEALLKGADERDYVTVVTTNTHTDRFPHWGTLPIVNAAQFYDVPIITARQLLEWLDARNGTTYSSIAWDGAVLSFTANVHPLARNIQTMVPLMNSGATPVITLNGQPAQTDIVTFKGLTYVRFFAESGAYTVTGL